MATPERDVTTDHPFHRPLVRGEMGFDPSRYDGLRREDGWYASVLSVEGPREARVPLTGIVREPFALSWTSSGGLLVSDTFRLYHLPTGTRLAETDGLRTALDVAATLRVLPLGARPTPDEVESVLRRTGYDMYYLVLDDIVAVPVWRHATPPSPALRS